ncbi:hypothetical protein [Paraburkholderia sp. DHOC27]|uniref:hypothetical protein n=1 Tax=Paraburkholderia sp. DHOC27 TaxID=2303330 RepID=UPI000E3BD690|nr:hypothetical protein [Paraburkholderia sp. DHOC27]RFU46445.1 hypothetical protein D0B32_15555 [Paraburkholderia sp. DHOC27]
MRALLERQLYHPAVVLPMVSLMQIMVAQDFNLSQVGVLVATMGARRALQRSRELICAVHHCNA